MAFKDQTSGGKGFVSICRATSLESRCAAEELLDNFLGTFLDDLVCN